MPIHIGTAGYVYPHWRKGAFYPSGLSHKQELSHYLTHFPTVEINATFHAFPRHATLEKWRLTSHPHTKFALKAPAVITHEKRLRGVSADVISFCNTAQDGLGDALGPILFQCPPSLRYSHDLLERFLEDLERARAACGIQLLIALEFRSADWFIMPVFRLLAEHNIALVNNIAVYDDMRLNDNHFPHARAIADMPCANWSYNRFHGSKNPNVFSDFPDSLLQTFAKGAAESFEQDRHHFTFFLNDWKAIAPRNARRYAQLSAELAGVPVKQLFGGFVPIWTRQKRSIDSFFAPRNANASSAKGVISDTDVAKPLPTMRPLQAKPSAASPSKKPVPSFAGLAQSKSPKELASPSKTAKSSAIQKKRRKNTSKDIASYFSSAPGKAP